MDGESEMPPMEEQDIPDSSELGEGNPLGQGEQYLNAMEAQQEGTMGKLGSFLKDKKEWLKVAAMVLGSAAAGSTGIYLMGVAMPHFIEIATGVAASNPELISRSDASILSLYTCFGGAAYGAGFAGMTEKASP